jgi:hypothetical protein
MSIAQEVPNKTRTNYPCRWGTVIKVHHPENCGCGCQGGKTGHVYGWGNPTPEVWIVKLDARPPFESSGNSRFHNEAAADAKVADLMREGYGLVYGGEIEALTWTSARTEGTGISLHTPGVDARAQVSMDGRLIKVKFTNDGRRLWRIDVYDARTLATVSSATRPQEKDAWLAVQRDLAALGWATSQSRWAS